MKNVVFYDGQCGLCDRVVQFLLEKDKKELFFFAPLQGRTAAKVLQQLPEDIKNADSLILLENNEVFLYGKAALKILWALGGVWAIPGSLSFLPGFLYNWAYRLVAKNRKRFFADACLLPNNTNKHRFLP